MQLVSLALATAGIVAAIGAPVRILRARAWFPVFVRPGIVPKRVCALGLALLIPSALLWLYCVHVAYKVFLDPGTPRLWGGSELGMTPTGLAVLYGVAELLLLPVTLGARPDPRRRSGPSRAGAPALARHRARARPSIRSEAPGDSPGGCSGRGDSATLGPGDLPRRCSMERTATCSCGQLSATVSGEPRMHGICSCLECQRATGSAFLQHGYWPRSMVLRIEGQRTTWRRTSDAGRWVDNHFCPRCGSTVFSIAELDPELVCVSIGSFADPSFPAPQYSVWERYRHHWVQAPASCERMDTQPEG